MSEDLKIDALGTVEFHYIKGNFFRVIHTDGAIANITPNNNISLCLFSERAAIPKSVEYEIDSHGTLKEISRVTRSGYVREIDADIMLDIETAIEIRDLLDATIKKSQKET